MKTINDYAELVKEKHALNKTIAPVETDLTDASREYHIGEQFIINGGLFKAKTEIAQHDALVLNTNYEPADNLTEQIKNAGGGTGTDPRLDVFENNIAPVETDETDASRAYQVGEQLILDNILYDVIAPISEHDVITTTGSGANIEPADPISSQFQTLSQNDADTWDNIYANGSINILENNAVTNTVNGITFTVYEDGTIKANGTSTVDYETWCYCDIKNKVLKAGSYKLSGSPSGGALNKYGVRVSLSDVKNGTATAEVTEYGDGATLTLASDKYYRTYTGVFIAARATVDNIIFKPMLTLASQPNSDYAHYVPYAKTNKELTEDTNAIEPMLNVLGAKNLLKNTASSATVYGVTFTVNSDGSVTANGTATATASLRISQQLPQGKYIVSGLQSAGSNQTFRMWIGIRNSSDTDWVNSYFIEEESGLEFEVPSGSPYVRVECEVRSGYTASNLVFKPMIRPADIKDSTYVPYAMTNRELTEKTIIEDVVITPSNGITIDYKHCYKIGNIVFLNFRFLLGSTATVATNAVIATVDKKPKTQILLPSFQTWDGSIGDMVQLNTNGTLVMPSVAKFAINKNFFINACYITED